MNFLLTGSLVEPELDFFYLSWGGAGAENFPFSRSCSPPSPNPVAAYNRSKNVLAYLKGASHEIEMGRIWNQKKDLEKLELRGWVRLLIAAMAEPEPWFLVTGGAGAVFELRLQLKDPNWK